MDINAITEQITIYITDYAWNILGAILIFFIGKWVARKVTSLLGSSSKQPQFSTNNPWTKNRLLP